MVRIFFDTFVDMSEDIRLPLSSGGLVFDLELEQLKDRLLGGPILGSDNSDEQRVVVDGDVQDLDSLDRAVAT